MRIRGVPVVHASVRERLALLALLALATLLYARDLGAPSLEFDEGVYLSSADLLARGLSAGRDVFTSQPPLFFTLLDAGNDLVGGDAAGLRALAVLLALAATLAGWAIVRRIAGPVPALAATGLLALTPGLVDAAAVVSADVPCVAFGAGRSWPPARRARGPGGARRQARCSSARWRRSSWRCPSASPCWRARWPTGRRGARSHGSRRERR